jgi:hypothetical protein
MAVTSPAFPATDAAAQPRPAAWLRVALLAAIPAALAAVLIKVTVGEGILDRAVAFEELHGGAVVDTPFTRTEQQAGMLLGDLIFAVGIAALLAGLLVLGSGRLPGHQRWSAAALAGAWGLLVVPAFAYPALPPGVGSGLDSAARQWLFGACVALGVGGALAAARAWRAIPGRERWSVGAALLAAPVAIAVLVLPDQRAEAGPPGDLVLEFRVASFASQAVFWIVLAAVGRRLLRPPA